MSLIHPEFERYRKKLRALGKDVFPRVVAEAINAAASFAHAHSIRNVRERFVLRNRYTENSIKFLKASPKSDWRKINAITGSISPYMDEQDAGGYRLPKSGKMAPEAQIPARSGSTTRRVAKRYAAGTLNPNQFVGIPRGVHKGKIRPHGVYERQRNNKRLRLIRKITQLKVRIQAKRWHRDAVESRANTAHMTAEFVRQAKAELRRMGAT